MTSQLNVDTIVDKAGSGGTNVKIGNTSTYVSDGGSATQNTVQGIAKCWGDYDQDSPSIKDSFNTSSVTDNSTGQYFPQFTNNMGSVNYASMSQTQPQSTTASCESFENESDKTTANTRITTVENASDTDHTNNAYVIHGDLA